MRTFGQPISKCATLLNFLKCMYDVLEAGRWAVLERNMIHHDISHGNIILIAEDFGGERKEEFKGKENRPIFVNELLNMYF
ncbi:hypothetical protein BDN71DRAFT_1594480 [Pleurotus eryngii]|uniref:Fungal-type protein kinase domain-containing protein n=1 Tax=Pleurotus eryngii TaxID=5323 RepID=A0A9P5ZKH0_PLEER|nr:hypothetical protein BDN71DRAFT_1594480 [Pleurotus eryngii]